MCGASSEQKDTYAAQSAFMHLLMKDYKQEYAQHAAILDTLTKSFQPILDKGINQEGFSEGELNNLNSQAVTGTGENYSKAAAALGASQGAEGGGTAYIPSGAEHQQQAALAESAASNESGIESNIKAEDYATGRANYLAAAAGLGNVAAEYNPQGGAGVANNSSSAAATSANEISQANNSWMQLVAAGLGAAGTAASGYLGKQ